ncbi:MAG TPA: DnaJ domain-containing protein [Cytophagaceae bacterium]|jgi:curved DNA-binding protein CbpA|nr:DnaJ domain-containing protein [Cytophagaceae bacterium]
MELNYYQILGISITASQDEIKAAFKKLAKEFHPDMHGSDKYYEEQFKRINSAYQTLSHPDKKARYDFKLRHRSADIPIFTFRKRANYSASQRASRQKKTKVAYDARMRKEKEKMQERKIFILTGAGFIIFLTASLFFYHYMNHYSAKLSIKKGIEAENEKKYYSAMELYSQALEYDDGFAEAYKRRADIKLNIYSNYRSALPDYTSAIKYSKNEQWVSFFSRAKCSAKLGMYEEAIQDLNYAISLNSINDSIYFYRAEINGFIFKHYLEAIIDYDLILSRDSTFSDARYGRSLANLASKEYDKAINDLSYLIDIDSANGGKYFLWRGFSKVSTGDTAGACADWNKSLNMGIPGSEEQIEKYCTKK